MNRFSIGAVIMLCAATAARAGLPPPGFVDQLVVVDNFDTGVFSPTAVRFDPESGDIWMTEKGISSTPGTARVRRRDALTGQVSTALTLTCLDTGGERGLLDLAFDPQFGQNRFVYLFYTRHYDSSGPCFVSGQVAGTRNRVARFVESAGQLTGETLVLQGPLLNQVGIHNGGTLRFAPDQTLMISMGDGGAVPSPTHVSQQLTDLKGKILRINPDGSIPADNPFIGVTGARPEIWAIGLRNPFRFTVHPETGTVVLTDVGQDAWEEIDTGVKGANYGWPCFEGPVPFVSCTPAPAPGSLTVPLFFYSHFDLTPPVTGHAVVGGPFYTATAFPPEYHGNYFFADFEQGWVRRAVLEPDGTLQQIEVFMIGVQSPVDLALGPDGCLYYATLAPNEVRKVCYTGGSNGQPHAAATITPVSGLAPVEVFFSGNASTDPDGDPLTYTWNFGDGGFSPNRRPSHIYGADGVYPASLTVRDDQGALNSADSTPPVNIIVGNTPPDGDLTAPQAGARYNAGDTVMFAGTGSDPQDGALGPGAFTWTVVFHHGSHTHPFLGPLSGLASGSFTIPATGEGDPNVAYEVRMDLTDSGGALGTAGRLTSRRSVALEPNVSTLALAADPPQPGLQLLFDGIPLDVPASRLSVVGWMRTLTAPLSQSSVPPDGRVYTFESWSDSGSASHTIVTPPADTTYTARFTCPTLEVPDDLEVSAPQGGMITLTWRASSDPCRQDLPGDKYAIYAGPTALPSLPPGNFPSDPPFTLLDTSQTNSYTFAPGPDTEFYLVLGIGRDGLPGPAGHY